MVATEYINQLHESEKKWFAVYTRYKREKRVLSALHQKGIDAYLPLLKLTRHYTRKIKKVELPLINCYLFVQIVKAEYLSVLETEEVVGFLKIGKNLISIPEQEINIMKKVVGEQLEVEVHTGLVQKGARVEVIGGQLTGLKGKLHEIKNEKNFSIELERMGYSIFMEVDPKYLKIIEAGGNPATKEKEVVPKATNWSIKI